MQNQKNLAPDAERYLRSAVIQMFDLKLKTGASIPEVRRFLSDCLEEAISTHRKGDASEGRDLVALAGVTRSWHTETPYLALDGSPRPLSLKGPKSLSTLIEMHFAKGETESIFLRLRDNELIKLHGRRQWLPAERHARVPKATTELLSHMAEGIGRLAETVMRNTQTARKEDLLFERACKVFRLPISEAQPFREYLQKQGVAFIQAVDDWLETRTLRTVDRHTKTCAAGAFAFAFIDDKPTRQKTLQKKKRSK